VSVAAWSERAADRARRRAGEGRHRRWAIVCAVIVLLAWIAAAVVVVLLLAVLGFELFGHVKRLTAAVAEAKRDLVPRVRRMLARLTGPDNPGEPAHPDGNPTLTLEGPGRHRAGP